LSLCEISFWVFRFSGSVNWVLSAHKNIGGDLNIKVYNIDCQLVKNKGFSLLKWVTFSWESINFFSEETQNEDNRGEIRQKKRKRKIIQGATVKFQM
jgi:hypothetical protein